MTTSTTGAQSILGSLRSTQGKGVVRMEGHLDVAVGEVWSALTDPGRIARWYGHVEGDLRPGGEFHLFVEADDWEGTGLVQACEPLQRLRVTTRESDESWRKGQGAPPFDDIIEATLTADDGGTVLVIEVRGIPLDKIAFYGAGWQIHVEHLAACLEGHEPAVAEARWNDLVPAYQALASDID